MGKKIKEQTESSEQHKKTKVHRFKEEPEADPDVKRTWPTDAVVYIGHLPHGFYQEQLKSYFSQYGEVLAVKVARSRITARSKGYAFIQFKYPQVANIVSETMNGYLLLGKVLISNTFPASKKNPFLYSSSTKYKFINWKRIFVEQNKQPKDQLQRAHLIDNLLKKQEKKRKKLESLNIKYEYPGFTALVPAEQPKPKKSKKNK